MIIYKNPDNIDGKIAKADIRAAYYAFDGWLFPGNPTRTMWHMNILLDHVSTFFEPYKEVFDAGDYPDITAELIEYLESRSGQHGFQRVRR